MAMTVSMHIDMITRRQKSEVFSDLLANFGADLGASGWAERGCKEQPKPAAATPGAAARNGKGATATASTRAKIHILISIKNFLLVLFVDTHQRAERSRGWRLWRSLFMPHGDFVQIRY
jgi:hypothetical protein